MAVFARYISAFKERRVQLSQLIKTKKIKSVKPDLESLYHAYYFAKILNHQQGFALIKAVSDERQWHIDLGEIARIWTNGCIIKSAFMEKCHMIFGQSTDLFSEHEVLDKLKEFEPSSREIVQQSIQKRVSVPVLFAALDYWFAITTQRSSAAVIQAQRDFFGAHTYQRTDQQSGAFFHTKWTEQ